MRSFLSFPRNIYLLAVCQIIGMSATTIVTLLGGLIGAEIAPSPTLTTFPATTMIVGIALTTIPAALLMKKIGRKNGFLLSAVIASFASLLLAYAVYSHNFSLFCLGTFLLGSNGAFVQQYRFAAIESVTKSLAGNVVGFVLMAGILAGIIGPELAKRTKDLFSLPEYTGPFILLSVLFGISALFISFLRNTKIQTEEIHPDERPLKSIIKQPPFILAVLAAATGYGVMTFIMTATPIHLHKVSHYSLDSTVFVIQSHIIAMFLPSLFTGMLIQRFGVFRILLSGLLSFCVTVLLAVNAHSVLPYWVALVLLGVGWNFLYISSTVLLTQSYSHLERFKAQGVNDFIVVLTQMTGSFFAGSLLFTAGWENLNLLTIPIIFSTFLIFLLYRRKIAVALQKPN
jgi:MFS family permease